MWSRPSMACPAGVPGGTWIGGLPAAWSAGVDLTSIDPRGLQRAAKLVRNSLGGEGNSKAHPFVLGGFSQGAMVACEVAFNSDEPLSALVLLSGAYVDSTGWGWKAAKRRGLPVFIAHGRQDDIYPFDQAERLRTHWKKDKAMDKEALTSRLCRSMAATKSPPKSRGPWASSSRRSERLRGASSPPCRGKSRPAGIFQCKGLAQFPGGLPICDSNASRGARRHWIQALELVGRKPHSLGRCPWRIAGFAR